MLLFMRSLIEAEKAAYRHAHTYHRHVHAHADIRAAPSAAQQSRMETGVQKKKKKGNPNRMTCNNIVVL